MSTPSREIVIVGGGIVGSCTAYYLSQMAAARGVQATITLLEGSGIAAGASGKAGGLLAEDWHGASTSSLASLSYRLHSDLASSLSGPERWGYRHLDTLSISADLSPSQARARKSSVDARFDWLNKDALRDTSQLGTKETTSQVHPRLFTEAMVEEAKKAGVKVVAATATGLQRTAGGGFSVMAGEQSFPATEVVVTAGPWTGRVLKQLGLKGGRASGIGGSRAHSVVLKTAEGRDLPAQALFTSIKEGRGMSEPEIYNRPDGTAYACGPTDSSPLPTLASEVKVDEQAIASIISQAGGLAPNYLAVNDSTHSATVVAKQACYLPVGSGDPVIGELEKNIYVGAGHSCWGITNGPGTGHCLAELILDGKVSSANINRLGP